MTGKSYAFLHPSKENGSVSLPGESQSLIQLYGSQDSTEHNSFSSCIHLLMWPQTLGLAQLLVCGHGARVKTVS